MVDSLKRAFVRWRDLDSHWQSLSGWFNPTVTRLFISWFALTPIFINVAGELPERIVFENFGEVPITLLLALPFSWKALWFASFLYAIAFVIYVFKCPRFIKDYRHYDHYKLRGHSPRWLVWEFYYAWSAISESQREKLFDRTLSKKIVVDAVDENLTDMPLVEEKSTTYVFEHEKKQYKVSIGECSAAATQSELFWELFGRWSKAHGFSRYLAWLCFYVAIAIVAYIVWQNIVFVLRGSLAATSEMQLMNLFSAGYMAYVQSAPQYSEDTIRIWRACIVSEDGAAAGCFDALEK